MTTIDVRRATRNDSRTLADLHTAAFPDYFLTHLGPSFLRRYYEAFLGEPHTVVIGSVNGRPVGFVAGTTDLARFQRGLYRRNLLHFPVIIAGRIVTDRVVRREITRRRHHVRLAISSMLRGRRPGRDDEGGKSSTPDSAISHLFAICVEPSAQGTGVAAMMTAYLDAERRNGARRVRLSVFTDNARAIKFYEHGGWMAVEVEGDSTVYELDLPA